MPTKKVASDVFTVNDFEALQNKGFWHRYGGLVAVLALHGALLWFVFNGLAHQTPPPSKVVAQTLIQEVALSRAPALKMPIPVSVPLIEPQPPAHAPVQAEPEPFAPQPPPPPPPEPVLVEPEPPPPTVPTSQAPKPVVVQRADPVANPTPPAAKPAATPAPAGAPAQSQVATPSAQSLKSEYVRQIKAMLNATKRYPTGRQASLERPVGKVRIVFVLSRNGALVSAQVQVSSNSNMLDDTALSAVRRATYSAFAGDLWRGQNTHEFSVDIDFVPPGTR